MLNELNVRQVERRRLTEEVVNELVSLIAGGKCAPCRVGTETMLGIFERLANGEGEQEDMAVLEELSNVMMLTSLCGLGQTAPVPIMDSLQYFRNDYENRIKQSLLLRSAKTVIRL